MDPIRLSASDLFVYSNKARASRQREEVCYPPRPTGRPQQQHHSIICPPLHATGLRSFPGTNFPFNSKRAAILALTVPSASFLRLAVRLWPRTCTRLTSTRTSLSFSCPTVYCSFPSTIVKRHEIRPFSRYLDTSRNMDSDESIFSMGEESDGFVPEPVSTISAPSRHFKCNSFCSSPPSGILHTLINSLTFFHLTWQRIHSVCH